MQNMLVSKQCQSHKLDAAALLLEEWKNLDDIILCTMCLIEKKFDQKKVAKIQEIPKMIQEMKYKQYNGKQEQLKDRFFYFQKLNSQIIIYKLWIEGQLTLILEEVQQQLKEIQIEINQETNNSFIIQNIAEVQQLDKIKNQINLADYDDILNLCKYLNNQKFSDKKLNAKDEEIVNYMLEQVNKFNQSKQHQQLLIALKNTQKQLNKTILEINWRFSQKYMHEKINLSNDYKTAISTSDFFNSVCLCDQAIPIQGTVAIEFKINKLKNILAGVCQKDQIDKDYNLGMFTKQCYFMFQDGSTYCNQQDVEQHNFKFNQNDVIRIEVNLSLKKIVWTNEIQNYPSITADIPIAQDLYFCFRMIGDTEIELI